MSELLSYWILYFLPYTWSSTLGVVTLYLSTVLSLLGIGYAVLFRRWNVLPPSLILQFTSFLVVEGRIFLKIEISIFVIMYLLQAIIVFHFIVDFMKALNKRSRKSCELQ